MMDVQLAQHTEALKNAQACQLARLRELYPLGSQLVFTIMHGQKTPSTGEVIAYQASNYGGHVIVRHDQAKPGSRYRNRTVYLHNIIGVEVAK